MAIDIEVTTRLPARLIDRARAAVADDFLKAYLAQSQQAVRDLATIPGPEDQMPDEPKRNPRKAEAEQGAPLLWPVPLLVTAPLPALWWGESGEGGEVPLVPAAVAKPEQQEVETPSRQTAASAATPVGAAGKPGGAVVPVGRTGARAIPRRPDQGSAKPHSLSVLAGADGAATSGEAADAAPAPPASRTLLKTTERAAGPASVSVPARLPPLQHPAPAREMAAPRQARLHVLVAAAVEASAKTAPASGKDGMVRYRFNTWPGQPSVDLRFGPALDSGVMVVASSANPQVRRVMLKHAGTRAAPLTIRFDPWDDSPVNPAPGGGQRQHDRGEEQ